MKLRKAFLLVVIENVFCLMFFGMLLDVLFCSADVKVSKIIMCLIIGFLWLISYSMCVVGLGLFAEYENHLHEEDEKEKQQEWLKQWDEMTDEPDKPKTTLVFGNSKDTGTNPHEFFNYVQKTTINMHDVELVERYNGIIKCYFMDLFFTYYLKKFLSLLDGEEWDPHEISDKEYIKTVLDKNKENFEAQKILRIEKPIDTIAEAVERVCMAVPLYRDFERAGVKEYNRI